jgi:phage-related protein
MANKVWVAVVPNTKNFASDLRKFLTRIERTLELIVDVRADTRRAENEVRASIERMSEGTATITVDADTSSAERRIRDVSSNRGATVNVDADTGLASAQVAAVARTRTVSLNVEVSKRSAAAVGTALAALSGGRVLESTFSKLGSTLGNLDKSVPAIAGLGMAVASVGSLALSSVGGIVTMGASLAPLAALAAPLPGLLLAGGAAAGVFAAAMADAGDQLGSLKPRFAALQDSISSKFWDKAKQPILDLVNGVLPSLQKGLNGVASSLGTWSGSVAGSFQKAFSPSVVSGILGPLSTSITNAAAGTGAFASAVATLGVFGAQYLPGIGTMFSNLSISFSSWISGVVSNGQLAGWVQDGIGVLQQLGAVASGAIGIIGGIASAATAAGSNGLQTLAGALGTISGIVNGPAFQGALTTVFTGAAQGAANLGRALGPIGGLFQTLAPVISSALSGLSLVAGELVSGLASALSQPVVATGLQTAIAGIMDGVEGLLPALPSLGVAFGAVLGVVGQLAGELGPVLGAALSAAAPIVTSLATALQPVIAMLGPALTQVIGAVAPVVSKLAAAFVPLISAVLPLLQAALGAVMPLIGALLPVITSLIAPVLQVVSTISGNLIPVITSLMPAVTQIVSILGSVLGPVLSALAPLFGILIPPIVQVAQTLLSVLIPVFEAVAPVILAVVSAVVPVIESLAKIVSGVVNVIAGLLSGNFSQAWKGAQQIVSGVWGVITGVISGAIKVVKSVITAGVNVVRSVISSVFGSLRGIVGGAMSAMASAVSSGISAVLSFFGALGGRITSALAGFGSLLLSVGRNLMQGFINGVTGFAARMIDAVTAPIRGAISAAKGLLGIHSPSRVFRQIGDYVGQGLERGLKGTTSGVKSAARSMTNAVITAFDQKQIKRAQTDQVLTTLARGNGRLVALANQRGSLAARLKAANKSLAAATATRDKYQKSVLESLQGVSVGDSNTGAGAIAALTRQVARTKQFTSVMTQLRKAGLDAVSYQQLIAKGVDALPLATSLLQGGSGQIKQVASLQGQLSKASSSFASSAANDLYGAGVNAAKGLVKGLQSQQAAIAKQMQGIANSMVGSVRKALGIHSPSRVFRDEIGKQIVAGLALGISSNTHRAHDAIDTLAGYRPDAGYLSASMSRVAVPNGSAAAGAGSTSKTYAPVFNNYRNAFTEREYLNAQHQIEVLTG